MVVAEVVVVVVVVAEMVVVEVQVVVGMLLVDVQGKGVGGGTISMEGGGGVVLVDSTRAEM